VPWQDPSWLLPACLLLLPRDALQHVAPVGHVLLFSLVAWPAAVCCRPMTLVFMPPWLPQSLGALWPLIGIRPTSTWCFMHPPPADKAPCLGYGWLAGCLAGFCPGWLMCFLAD
jgi:hypothetical protein